SHRRSEFSSRSPVQLALRRLASFSTLLPAPALGMWTTSTHHPLLTQLAASAGHHAPEAGRLPSAPHYQPHRAQAHSVLRHPMHPGTVGPLANRPRPHPPGEQDRGPDHAIIDQRLVAGAWYGVKIILVFDADARNRDHRTRHLGAELQTDALVGLNADDQEI